MELFKVVLSRILARPSCILHRVMGLASPVDRRSEGDARPMTRGRIQLGRADVRNDTTLAMVLAFISHQHAQSNLAWTREPQIRK